ncbi:MAG: tetratricopeptide repeat protein, partial [Saprospiraceae bacterium]
DTMEAVRNYRKSIEMDSSKWPLHEEIAQMFYKSKKFCDAAIAYQVYIDSLTETQAIVNATYYLGLSHYYCTTDSLRFVKAEKAFSRITELVPDAGIGWVWRAKALSKLDPDVAGNPGDSTILNEFGKAQPSFEKYVVIGEKDSVKNKKDLISAYEYLVYYYFLKKDDVKAREHLQNLFRHDPVNPTGIEIQKFMDGETPAPPPIKDKRKD